jgi:hypothetical protein
LLLSLLLLRQGERLFNRGLLALKLVSKLEEVLVVVVATSAHLRVLRVVVVVVVAHLAE